jgi:hypothetical protein
MRSRIRILICIKVKKAGSGSEFEGCGSATLKKSRLKRPVRVTFHKMPATLSNFLKIHIRPREKFLVHHAVLVRLLGIWACMTSTWPFSGYNRISLLSGMNRI